MLLPAGQRNFKPPMKKSVAKQTLNAVTAITLLTKDEGKDLAINAGVAMTTATMMTVAMMDIATPDDAMIGVATIIAVMTDAAMSALRAIPTAMTNTAAPTIMDVPDAMIAIASKAVAHTMHTTSMTMINLQVLTVRALAAPGADQTPTTPRAHTNPTIPRNLSPATTAL